MKVTERVAAGEEKDLPALRQAPPSMTSQMNVECRELVKERYRTRFTLAAQLCDPEPISSPAAVFHTSPASVEFPATFHSAHSQPGASVVTAREKPTKIPRISKKNSFVFTYILLMFIENLLLQRITSIPVFLVRLYFL
jgi:hypothetical protein